MKYILAMLLFTIILFAEVKKEYYPSGELLSESPYENGKIVGKVKTYYRSGVLKSEVSYLNGEVTGIVKEYYESGKLKSTVLYIKGKPMKGL